MSNDSLEFATQRLRETPIPAGPSPDALAAVERFPATARTVPMMNRRSLLRAASIGILAIAIAAIVLTQRRGGSAFAAVAQAIRQTQTFTAELQVAPLPQPLQFSAKGSRMRLEYPGTTVIVDRETKTFLQLLPFTRTAKQGGLSDDGFGAANVDLYGLLRDYHTGQEEALGEKTIDGRAARGFRLVRDKDQTWTFWVDPKTSLPVQIEVRNLGESVSVVLAKLKFDVPLDDALFAMTIPPGFNVAAATAKTKMAGTVVDERGRPVAGATAALAYKIPDGRTVYDESVRTDASGRFTIEYNGPAGNESRPMTITAAHRDFLVARVEGVEKLPEKQRGEIRVTLKDGVALRGKVVDPEKRPVAGALVATAFADNRGRRSTVSGGDGTFTLRGLPAESGSVHARKTVAGAAILCGRAKIDLRKSQDAGEIVIQPLELPANLKTHSLFGMTLIDLNENLRERLSLRPTSHVMILDPGKNSARLSIGELQACDAFWMVGEKKINTFDEFVQGLLAEWESQKKNGKIFFGVRVVYDFERDDSGGTNTQYMSLTPEDVKELQNAIAR
jgi:outer membrane lipoprotein-sorting protein